MNATGSHEQSWAHDIALEPVTGIVLAGGQSRRMGTDKSLLPFHGRPLIQHVCDQLRLLVSDILIAANSDGRFSFLSLPVITDEVPGQGPLRGIASALAASRHDLNFVIACDIPWVDHVLLKFLLQEAQGCDCVMPVTREGYYEPLFAVYRKNALPAMLSALESGQRRVTALFPYCRVRTIVVPDRKWLDNVNTRDDYQRAVGAGGLDAWQEASPSKVAESDHVMDMQGRRL